MRTRGGERGGRDLVSVKGTRSVKKEEGRRFEGEFKGRPKHLAGKSDCVEGESRRRRRSFMPVAVARSAKRKERRRVPGGDITMPMRLSRPSRRQTGDSWRQKRVQGLECPTRSTGRRIENYSGSRGVDGPVRLKKPGAVSRNLGPMTQESYGRKEKTSPTLPEGDALSPRTCLSSGVEDQWKPNPLCMEGRRGGASSYPVRAGGMKGLPNGQQIMTSLCPSLTSANEEFPASQPGAPPRAETY